MEAQSKNNLSLWEKVSKTDPAYTKKFSQGFTGTSVNSTYLIRLATEQWGMIGLDWGYDILEERTDNGAPVYNDSGEIIGHIQTHTIKLCLWVKRGKEYARVEHFGHTPYVYYSPKNNKWITDQEAPKKSLTDAIKKCLSMFGFSADIFLGLFDDVGYVQEIMAEAEINKIDNKMEADVKAKQIYKEWFDKHLKIIETAVTINELELIFKSSYRKAQRQNDRDGLLKLTRSKDTRLKHLQAKEDKKHGSTTPPDRGNEAA